jgi:type I restriction enzyme, S subunit
MVVEQATETAEFKQTEVGLIPIEYGSSAKSKRIGSVPVLRMGNLQNGKIVWDDLVYTNDELEIKRYLLRNNDVLFNRTNSIDLVGKTAIYKAEMPAIFAGYLIRINVKDFLLDNDYLNYFLNTKQAKKFGSLVVSLGVSQANISGAKLKTYPIPLPPTLDEQRAIATALSDVDALITGLDALIAKKRAIKQGTMQQLLTGKKRLPGFEGEWETKTLGECLLEKPKYGINAAAVDFNDNLPKYIRITDITEDGKFSPDKPVSVNHFLSDNYYLEDGDLVFARTGASVGKSYQYKVDDGRLVYAGFLIKVKPDSSKLNITFLKNYTETGIYKNWVSLMSMRSGQPGINGNEYASLPISLPKSIEEQQAIAKILSDMDTEITALAQKRDKYKTVKQGMMQQLLTGKIRLV